MKFCKAAVVVLVSMLMLCGCTDAPGAKDSSSSGATFQTVEANSGGDSASGSTEEITFDQANILKFNLQQRDDKSYEEIIATFMVKNDSADDITNFSADFSYNDSEGNSICDDSRVVDFGIQPKKSSCVVSYSSLEGVKKKDIDQIEVSAYTYTIDDVTYEVDLSNKDVTTYTTENDSETKVDFDGYNILSFDYKDMGKVTDSLYKVIVKAKNNGDRAVSYISIDMAYFDKDGNLIYTDGRFNDKSIKPGKFVSTNSFSDGDYFDASVKSFGVYKYEYRLSEEDKNGFNCYEVNMRTGEAVGSLIEE